MSINQAAHKDLDEGFKPRRISGQSGCTIDLIDPGVVRKYGYRVSRNEETALRLVKEHTRIPVPTMHLASYNWKQGREHGSLIMDLVDGTQLSDLWARLNDDDDADNTKRRICCSIWAVVEELRRIPRHATFNPTVVSAIVSCYQCGADGSPTRDVLLQDLRNPPSPLPTDEALRARINERYLHDNSGSYGQDLSGMLPHSDVSVFTLGDMTPRNILIDGTGRITGIVDWENAGWYPDYW